MLTLDEARQIAEAHFPWGPEALAEQLGITVLSATLTGCDGWVLTGPAGTVIRLNAANPKPRRRFTLAHELGHLLLGVPTVVGETVYESLRSDNSEERRVNDLAAELLLPEARIRQAFPQVPVVASQLRRFAAQAKVSELAVAIRVANLAQQIELINACVTFFRNDTFEWNWSKTLNMPAELAVALLEDAKACAPNPLRVPRKKTKDVIIASLVENPWNSSTTLFVQLLPIEVGSQPSAVERRHELEAYLVGDDNEFRMSLAGVFGAFRPKCTGLTLEQAFKLFYETKRDRWDGHRRTRLLSEKGREYVRLRLSEWCLE
ncbi:MAG: ImmA/IrrE family metallo-endopeptidase [Planctomycetaceae bacterium]|nr:ImmA/IrrE family metallo-endopeptidase [Planctomycetaceae bacterium]